jgi:hypothetical protein
MPGVESCAQVLAASLEVRVETATDRESALERLSENEFGVVVVEAGMVEADSAWADRIWDLAGLAMPLQVNFAITGCSRLAREVRAALLRRDSEQALALRTVAAQMEGELKESVAGLLLHSELALREPGMPASLAPRMRQLVELVGAMRERLANPNHMSASGDNR